MVKLTEGWAANFYARLLLIVARDNAAPLQEAATRVEPVTVACFLDAPLGLPTWHLPRERESGRLQAQFRHSSIGSGWLNFTYFVQLEEIMSQSIDV